MKQPNHPDVDSIRIEAVLYALSDPLRLSIVRCLDRDAEACCGDLTRDVPPSTASHHFKVLRESGVIRVRQEGTRRITSLRKRELNSRFPGLLRAVLRSSEPSAS